ncbi:rhodanese-like domain-containing protein [Pseudodesulfovibrio cashew]|uniref:Rhodanese-like domain-containing protein n=3 Tax=Pseudodesulfovibrio cashew TaxID=2678688 RepID=A0A6I6JE11_9BACT|nr:rhodanese-like domain-containing protein [Pseudodesulfovibrio cashew]
MRKPRKFAACLLLALCLFALPASADENEIWWKDAVDEAAREGYSLIDTRDLAELLDSDTDAIIIDARADYEFEAGHVPDAENLEFDLGDKLSLSQEKRAAFEELVGSDRKRKLVIYCRSFR